MLQQIDISALELNPFEAIGKDAFLISAATDNGWNVMTASWGFMGYIWDRAVFVVVIRDSRYTYQFMEQATGFTCSFFSPQYKNDLAFCGSHSGRDTDKIAATSLVPLFVEPKLVTFEQANLVFCCTKAARIPIDPSQFISTDIDRHYPKKDYHRMYIGFIDKVLAQEG